VKLDEARYVEHWHRVAPVGPAHAADLYLACACLHGDPAAAHALETTFLRGIGTYVARYGDGDAFVDEVRRELRERLLLGEGDHAPKIGEYAARGPLGAWIRVCAVRTALNLRRSLTRQRRPEVDELFARDADPELSLLRERYGPQLQDALRAALGRLDGHDRTLLRLHFVEEMSIDRLGTIYGVHRATAARRIIAARERVLADALRSLSLTLGATPSEVKSLYGALRSQIQLSLSEIVA
jgi:RNA polymerase sigma-70 factor (ECF subfamily)